MPESQRLTLGLLQLFSTFVCLFVCFCVFDRASLNSELLNLYRQTDLQATDI